MHDRSDTGAPSQVRKIAIIGAGIGGLTAALALSRAGFEVAVYERSDALAEVGAGITLWQNALKALEHLGLKDALAAVAARPNAGIIARSSGKVLASFEGIDTLAGIAQPVLLTFHRRDLQEKLFTALDANLVHFSKSLVHCETQQDRAVARFSDGDALTADLLIGADGIASRVRAEILQDGPPRYAGYTCWRGVTEIPAKWRGVVGEFWGAGDRFGLVQIGGGRLYWFAVANAPPQRKVEPSQVKSHLLAKFSQYAFDVPAIIERTPDDAIVQHDILDRKPVKRWSRGRIVLLGDAAHPTTPNMGQGAAMAIESALVLGRALQQFPVLSDALRAYVTERMPRTAQVNRNSRRLGRMAQWQHPLLRTLRDVVLRSAPRDLQLRGLARLISYDAATVPLRGG